MLSHHWHFLSLPRFSFLAWFSFRFPGFFLIEKIDDVAPDNAPPDGKTHFSPNASKWLLWEGFRPSTPCFIQIGDYLKVFRRSPVMQRRRSVSKLHEPSVRRI